MSHELSHDGLRPDRNQLYPERIFSELWKEKNKRHLSINGGNTALELIINLLPRPAHVLNPPGEVSPVSQRDADVAATVIQWLGSKDGAVFLAEAESQIRKERERLSEEFNERFNKVYA